MKPGLYFGDLFCGCGGAARGMIAAGLTPLWAVDIRPEECEAYQALLQARGIRGARVLCADVRFLDPEGLERPDLIWASPPCGPWSEGRRAHRIPSGFEIPEGQLLLVAARFIARIGPRAAVIENVDGIPPEALAEAARILEEAGYSTRAVVLDVSLILPQKRAHAFLLASQGGRPVIPALMLPARPPRFADIRDGTGARPLSETQVRYILKRKWQTPLVGPGDLLPTVTTRPWDQRWTCVVYEEGGRLRFPTFREALRAQGFGDDEILLKVHEDNPPLAWRMLGNAVPPPLAEIVARAALATGGRDAE